MQRALAEAAAAAARGEVPVGAVLFSAAGEILAADGNRTEANDDPTAHAEINVIRKACAAMAAARLPGAVLYVTLEPCAMCAAAISEARIARVVYAAYDPKGGAVDHGPRLYTQATCHHRPEVVSGIEEAESARLLRDFFAARR